MIDLPGLFAYTEWDDAALLDAAEAQDAEAQGAWTRDLGGAFPTLQAVLSHVAGGEWVWLRRWTGGSPTAFPGWSAGATPGQLRDVFAGIVGERRAWLGGLTPADLVASRPYTLFSGLRSDEPLGVQMQHVVTHSTYHRGQAAAMLRRLGTTPPQTDLIVWARLGQPGVSGA